MAIIQTVDDAINRIRTILDRGNSPWMSNAEIDDFISMAANEFLQERVDNFGATQRIRDDLGDFVKSMAFTDTSASGVSVGELLNFATTNFDGQPLSWLNPFATPGVEGVSINIKSISWNMGPISNLACDMTSIVSPIDNQAGEAFRNDVSYVIGIKRVDVLTGTNLTTGQLAIQRIDTKNIKIISLDDLEGSRDDPFNQPNEDNLRAVKVGNLYYIIPDAVDINTFGGMNSMYTGGTATNMAFIVFDYVSDNCISENVVNNLPKHSVEEVCQIAARKILGTTADERYPVGDAEIRQLNK